MMTSVELCRDEIALARRLGRQLRQSHASPLGITEKVDNAFDHEEARLAALRDAFRERVVRLRSIQRGEG